MSENGDDIVEEEPQEMEVVEEAEVEDGNRVSSDSGRFVSPFFTFFNFQKFFKNFFKLCYSGESEEEEYEVERIVATRLVKKKPQYLVKWVNYDEQVGILNFLGQIRDFLAKSRWKMFLGSYFG